MTDPQAFWQATPDDSLRTLAATRDGLSSDEAAARLERDGLNEISAAKQRHLLLDLLRRLGNPLIAILLVAAGIAGATGDMASFAIIFIVVVLSTALDLVQEHRAEATAEALKQAIALHATVLRDGKPIELPVRELVAGDIVMLAAGDLVPADGIVLAANGAQVNEALLTGEPYPVEKQIEPVMTAETPADARNALFHGTSLIGGTATMLVVQTGLRTRFGAIARSLAGKQPATAFEHGIHKLGTLIVRLTIFLVLFVLLAHLALGRPPLQSFLFAMALAVGLTPELLPMIMTVALGRGAQRMAKAKVVVKRLSAIHDLGQMDILCTDKTGTLTEARITLVGHPGIDGEDDERVAELAAVNARFETGLKSPLDQALVLHMTGRSLEDWRKLDERPFDFERRRVAVLAEQGSERIEIVKGAPETLLALCTRAQDRSGALLPLDDGLRARLCALRDDRAAQGLRLLAIAWKPAAGQERIDAHGEDELVFAGYCVFVDPPKPSATTAVARLEAAGIRIKVISGDAAPVIQHLVAALALPVEGILTGEEIAKLNDSALAARVEQVDLFARVTPDQKTRIVRALRARGHTVGFIGDGINDAPAIRAADVGLSVDGATDVAREAADMILLAPDLGVLADGVAEGRRTYANIMKYVRMGTSSNFGNMLTMAVASLFLPFLPLTPVQVLLNNLLYDLSEIGIPFDTADSDDLARPQGWDMRGLVRFTAIMGPLSSLFDLATFALLLGVFHVGIPEFRTAWFMESMLTQILVVFVIRTSRPAWSSRPHIVLTVTALAGLAAALLLPLLPSAGLLGFTMPGGTIFGAIALLVVGYLVSAECLKRYALRPVKSAHR
ncbi:magnesium-translocating P-type ATPase [Sphingomonas sanxanigenens]|uniref:Magnesium-transporting ATPase, P-type 1 n=1 Tax=Sphingomonas sanxanigenens DSM 19645 = NX02 TaxID=1123269 RepID=W0ABC7_9SPHN|nr:magnesium-translocating P-type ATPase [Sphingomonas sanxanigenens]AHE53608.1 cation-transporting ATPase [Sphingomonas sanxanigenens DSM 19645 = NX02]